MTLNISIPAGARTYWTMIAVALVSYAAARIADSDALGFAVLATLLTANWVLGRSSVSLLKDAVIARPWGFLGRSHRISVDQIITARATLIDEDPHLDLVLQSEIVSMGPWQPFFRDALLAQVERTAEAVRTHRIQAALHPARMPLASSH